MCMFNYCLSKNRVHFYAASYYIKWTRLPGHTVPSFIEESDYAADSEFEEGRENLNNREGHTVINIILPELEKALDFTLSFTHRGLLK